MTKNAHASPDLTRFVEIASRFGTEAAADKKRCLENLRTERLGSLDELVRLHETLLFVRAYPDDAEVLQLADRCLAEFSKRRDLNAYRKDLENSGIAGTEIRFPCWWTMAHWLANTWPEHVTLDWDEFENAPYLDKIWSLLLPHTESPYLDEYDRSPREWIEDIAGFAETDAAFLIRRFAAMDVGSLPRETLYDNFDVPLRIPSIEPERDSGLRRTPSRTLDRWPWPNVHFQAEELDRSRPDLAKAAKVAPVSMTRLSTEDGQRLIELARSAMLTRTRDLDGFANANPDDAHIVDCGDGLAFGMLGLLPERRLMFDSSYALLTLKNGIPAGYVLISALFGSAAIAYNVFEAFRGGEAARILGHVFSVARHVFGVDSFSIDPYQLGQGNDEGLRSGAWWFYYKLGFRPRDPDVHRVLRAELAHMKKNPRHRSSESTMRKLVVDTMHFHLGKPRDDVLGIVSLGNVGRVITHAMGFQFGSQRERGLDVCDREAVELCGRRTIQAKRGWTDAEKLWWRRWSPLIVILPKLRSWPDEDKKRLVAVVRAKGSWHEADFVKLFDDFPRLRKAFLDFAAREE
ncbi:MAG: hypothetical protein H6832_11425 [Planctomycetes bacterium]|nr:hypothetical protein [Planctomycetota bacterium]MCB9919001.1 hypothetical protein [Planctomycetota bacterium]